MSEIALHNSAGENGYDFSSQSRVPRPFTNRYAGKTDRTGRFFFLEPLSTSNFFRVNLGQRSVLDSER